MSGIEKLKARLGGNIRESMSVESAALPGKAIPAAGGVLGGGEKFKGTARVKDALAIRLDQITPDPGQPRKEFDEAAIDDLAASLKSRGQLQPIRVRWEEAMGRWVVIAGERRYRAALRAGLPTLMCIEAGPQTPDDILEDQLVENCLREDLRPIEQARAFRALMDRRGWSHRQLGEHLHVAHGTITRAVALLDLPPDVRGRVEGGDLSPSAAYQVSRIEDADAQRAVAERIVSEGLKRDEVVEVVRRATGRLAKVTGKGRGAGKGKAPASRVFRTPDGYRVTVEHRRGVERDAVPSALREVLSQFDFPAPAPGTDPGEANAA
jgi:ParB family transcriptional regulator, chromosome partitioning protein